MRVLPLLLLIIVTVTANPSRAPHSQSSRSIDTASSTTDTVDTVDTLDTATSIEPEGSLSSEPVGGEFVGDTAIADTPLASSTLADSIPSDTAAPLFDSASVDTSFRVWHRPFMGVGVGWAVGGMPVFDLWETGLPEQVTDLSRGADSAMATGFGIVEEPNPYNVSFPLTVTYSTPLRDGRRIALAASFAGIRKTFRGTAESDSLGTWWERTARLALASASLEGALYVNINDEYFSIDNVDNTSFVLGLGVTPWARLTLYNREQNHSIHKSFSREHHYNGVGASWTLGVSSLKKVSGGNGIEVGVVYQGHRYGYFRGNGGRLNRGALNPNDEADGDPLSFTAHRFKIYLQLLFGKKPDHRESIDTNK
ncbi:MAG: hypothetical protein GF344_18585 [Chitinivibrionales bacterium]|nr:hypothetical protein [Chitinivibrionales bacterium]MBD3358656.1 hypothetical protein [Chitinivibrionales bacterium]